MRGSGVHLGGSLARIAARVRTAALAIAVVLVGALVGCGASSPRMMSPSLGDASAGEPALEGDGLGDDLTGNREGEQLGMTGDWRTNERQGEVRTDAHDDRDVDQTLDGGALGSNDRRGRAGPPIAEVVAAAYAAAGLGGPMPGHTAMRARLGGLVPWVSVRTGRDASWHDEDPDVGRGTTLEVRATWRLDRLVFDGRELQVVALEAARRRERRRLATHVIRTYFTWKRAGSRIRADEAAAELDALTSGWFSETTQRAASESRTVRTPATTP